MKQAVSTPAAMPPSDKISSCPPLRVPVLRYLVSCTNTSIHGCEQHSLENNGTDGTVPNGEGDTPFIRNSQTAGQTPHTDRTVAAPSAQRGHLSPRVGDRRHTAVIFCTENPAPALLLFCLEEWV